MAEEAWRTRCKKFLTRNYGGPGVTTESMADGSRRFLAPVRRSDALWMSTVYRAVSIRCIFLSHGCGEYNAARARKAG